ncbi:MAG TPA: DUF2207 domain-containing protein [Actinomycetes bacterium]|nr:DUF2207 domain-containing protein [Actinomycetes bacterium]
MNSVRRTCRRWAAVAGVVACAALLSAGPMASSASAAAGDGFIPRYDVDIVVNQDGTLDITERIDYTFTDSSHGIYRTIANRYPVTETFTPEGSDTEIDTSYDRVIDIDDIEVTSPSGAPTDLDINQEGQALVIRIGDPKETISGPQNYVITYTVTGALNSFENHEELNWNAIATEWLVPIQQATVSIRAPEVQDARCFMGAYGARFRCETLKVRQTSVEASQRQVGNGIGVTIVVAMPPGSVDVPEPMYEQRWSLERAFTIDRSTVGAGVAALALGGVGVWALLRRGRDRRYVGQIPGLSPVAGTSAAEEVRPFGDSPEGPVEWSPPDDLRPGLLGTLIDEQANVLDVTATIVDLAVRGYLRIDEIPDAGLFSSRDWQLVQLKGGDADLLDYELKLFAALFDGRNVVKLSELKRTFAADLAKVQNSMYDELVYRKWYRRRPDSTRTSWGLFSVLLVVLAGGVTYLLARYTHFGIVGIALIVAAIALVIASRAMPARTGAGSAVLARTLGFRRYLATAEAGQIRFEEGEDIFSKYLPYAIVFGEADRWAKVFASLAAAGGGAAAAAPAVHWYTSPHPWTYASFGESVNSFSVTTSGSISAAAASSKSGFGGGGGGFSGGGFGGGGGGGW